MSDEISYLDFEITVDKAADEYLVCARSGDGKAEIRFTNPFNDDKRALISATLSSSTPIRVKTQPAIRVCGRLWAASK